MIQIEEERVLLLKKMIKHELILIEKQYAFLCENNKSLELWKELKKEEAILKEWSKEIE